MVKNFAGEECFLFGSYEKAVELWRKALQETQGNGRGLLKIIFAMRSVGTDVSRHQSVKIISSASAQNFFMLK